MTDNSRPNEDGGSQDGDSDSDERASTIPDSPLKQALIDLANVASLRDSYEAFTETNWYAASLTAFNLGFLGLIIWSVYFMFILAVVGLLSSQSIFDILAGIFTIGPLVPIGALLFAAYSHRAVEGIEEIHTTDDPDEPPTFFLLTVSGIALFIAAAYRAVLYSTLHEMYGLTLSSMNVVSVMIVDGLHISLLLMGIGGLSAVITAPSGE